MSNSGLTFYAAMNFSLKPEANFIFDVIDKRNQKSRKIQQRWLIKKNIYFTYNWLLCPLPYPSSLHLPPPQKTLNYIAANIQICITAISTSKIPIIEGAGKTYYFRLA